MLFSPPLPLGRQGELAAGRYLRRCGYTLIAGGQRSRYGEIDLIAVDHHTSDHHTGGWSRTLARCIRRETQRRTLVFVEVKTRRSDRLGSPASAVDVAKQRRLTDAALAYLKSHQLLEYPARFDVVAITWPRGERRPAAIEHFKSAFEATGRWQLYS